MPNKKCFILKIEKLIDISEKIFHRLLLISDKKIICYGNLIETNISDDKIRLYKLYKEDNYIMKLYIKEK